MTLTTLTRYRSMTPIDSAHARAISKWRVAVDQKRATVTIEIATGLRTRSGIPRERPRSRARSRQANRRSVR
jgi:hypothetical protein